MLENQKWWRWIMGSRQTGAERALKLQIAEAREVFRLAQGYRPGDPDRAPSAAPSVHELVRAQAALSRLTLALEQRRAARLAGAERDPLRRLERMRDLAEQEGSWTAAARLGAEARALRREQEEQARATEEERNRELSPEERAAMLAGLVKGASDDELEVCVAEWLERRRYHLEVDDGGTLRLLPAGETLRLVK